ncbi:MAG: aspartate-semialdehyde dehydrogenase [Rickettsiales bacterium]|nr:aspartate-semialdehyde dehydrogenase [Rickettsiales bacterium]|tara:strand:+ start:1068 stop:2093 length:1026 start_codon:yes stop_codon:yes gene_type:complete
MSYRVAVVGATGNVGRELLSILAERHFPVSTVDAVASAASLGKEVSFGEEKILKVQSLDDYDFTKTDIALFSPGGKVSAKFAPKAAEQGCVVIDNTSHFRMEDDIPLVVPEVNAPALKDYRKRNIIANPNCSTIQMVHAINPLHKEYGIKRIVVSTYQSVSGAGKSAMDELYNQTKSLYVNNETTNENFTKRIAFNVIPHIDVFMDDGSTKEEWKMINETAKIMGSKIPVAANCVRVPVFVGHGEMVNLEFDNPFELEEVYEILEDAEGISVVDRREDGGYMTPYEATGEDATFVSRVRRDASVKNGLSMWIVSDNVRKGAALNSIQIAETLVESFGLTPR